MRFPARGEQVVTRPDGVEALRIGKLRFAKDGIGATVGVKLQPKFHGVKGKILLGTGRTHDDTRRCL